MFETSLFGSWKAWWSPRLIIITIIIITRIFIQDNLSVLKRTVINRVLFCFVSFIFVWPLFFFLWPGFLNQRAAQKRKFWCFEKIDSFRIKKVERTQENQLSAKIRQTPITRNIFRQQLPSKIWKDIGSSRFPWLPFFFDFELETLRPVSNVELLPCRTQLIELNSTLARQ